MHHFKISVLAQLDVHKLNFDYRCLSKAAFQTLFQVEKGFMNSEFYFFFYWHLSLLSVFFMGNTVYGRNDSWEFLYVWREKDSLKILWMIFFLGSYTSLTIQMVYFTGTLLRWIYSIQPILNLLVTHCPISRYVSTHEHRDGCWQPSFRNCSRFQ